MKPNPQSSEKYIERNLVEAAKSMSNADLALEYLKKCQQCREKGVPNDMAVLAALQDLADYKDEHPVITANLFRQCIFMLNEVCYEQGTGVDGVDIDYAIKKYDLK